MVAHFTMRTHGVSQAFRFVEGIWLPQDPQSRLEEPWYLYRMVAQSMLRTYYDVKLKIGPFRFVIGFGDSFAVTKCLQQIEMHDLLHVK